jgi:hypothetical protein
MSAVETQSESKLPPLVSARLRVWWIPQVPMEPFYVDVRSITEAKLVIKTLADYDLFQFDHHIKPDYSNVGGLEEFVDGKWIDWEDEDGYDIWGD